MRYRSPHGTARRITVRHWPVTVAGEKRGAEKGRPFVLELGAPKGGKAPPPRRFKTMREAVTFARRLRRAYATGAGEAVTVEAMPVSLDARGAPRASQRGRYRYRRVNPTKGATVAKRRKGRKHRSAAQRAATARMLAANKARRRGKRTGGGRRRKSSSSSSGAGSFRSRLLAMMGGGAAPRKGKTMAKRRRRKSSSTGKKRHHRRRRRNPAIIVRRRSARRSNPSPTAFVKTALGVTVPAVAAGGASAFIDAKFFARSSALVRTAVKVGEAALAGMVLRSRPQMAAATMGAILGTIGAEFGTRAAGGVHNGDKQGAIEDVTAMAAQDEAALGTLYENMQGLGLLDSGSGEVSLGGIGAVGDDVPDLGDVDEDGQVSGIDDVEDDAA